MEEFRDGPSYTVDLLRHYRMSNDDDVHLIIGADSLAEMQSWRDPETILELATLVVFPRSGYASIVPVDAAASVVLFEDPIIDISSTEVRAAYKLGEDAIDQLPPGIHDFILDNSLYS
jgi:nicotinate-nucleotide adenylyltransferase